MNENQTKLKAERAFMRLEALWEEEVKRSESLEKYLGDSVQENELKAYERGKKRAYMDAIEILKTLLD